MAGSQSLTNDVDLDLKGLLVAVWRKKFLLLLLTLISGALIFLALQTVSPRYKSDAQVLITKRESVFTEIQSNQTRPNGGEFDQQAVGSQALILQSDDLAAQVIRKLNLETHNEFKGKAEQGLLSKASDVPGPSESTAPLAGAAAPVHNVSPGVLKKFKEQLTVYSAKQSRVIVIEFWSTDRRLARDVPNTLAELYLQTTKDARLETDSSATDWLRPEIDKLRVKVREAEAKVAEFRSQSDILLGNNNALLATQQLSEVSSELSRVRAERSAAQARVETIRSALANGGSVDVIPEVISSPLIQRLREREVTLQAQISELSTTLLPNHPRIKALRSQLPQVRSQIRNAATNIQTSVENNVKSLRKQEQVLLQELNRFKSESARVGEAEVQLRALEREAAAQRERLEGYLLRFNEAEGRQSAGYVPSQAKIIEHAILPAQHYFPKVMPFTIAGMLALLILSIVALLAIELLSGRAFKPIVGPRQEDKPVRVEIEPAGVNIEPRRVENEFGAAAGQGATDPVVRARMAAMAVKSGRLARAAGDGNTKPMNSQQVSQPDTYADIDQTRPDSASDQIPQPPLNAPFAADAKLPDEDVFELDFTLKALAASEHSAIAVVSPGERKDNAEFVGEVARRLSGMGKSVAVVDFTGSAGTSLHLLGSLPQIGLIDVLTGRAGLRESLFIDQHSNAHVLAPGNPADAGSGMKSVPNVTGTLEDSYQICLYDCGDASAQGVGRIANEDTIIIIPVKDSSSAEARQLEQTMKENGFLETIMVHDVSDGPYSHAA